MKSRLLRLLSPEILRLDEHIRLVDHQLYAQKALLRSQARRLQARALQRLRSPWVVVAAFGAGFLSGWLRRPAARSDQPTLSLQRLPATLRLLRMRLRKAAPLLQSLAGLYAARGPGRV